MSPTGKSALEALLPLDAFVELHERTLRDSNCAARYGCPYNVTACRMRALIEALREWWRARHPGKHRAEIEILTGVIDRFRRLEHSPFYMLFWPSSSVSNEEIHRELLRFAAESMASPRRR